MRARGIHSGALALLGCGAALLMVAPVSAQQLGGLLNDSDVSGGGPAADQGVAPVDTGSTSRRASGQQRQRRKVAIVPYLEIDQTAFYDVKGGGDRVQSYTSAAVGVNASVQTRSVAAGADLRYEHQFAWSGDGADQDIISGIANGRVNLLRDFLSLEAGGLATRARTDGYAGANNSLASARSTANIYSAYIGPDLNVPMGDLALNASYRLGYNRLENNDPAVALTNAPTGSFDESWVHYAHGALGMKPGRLPFGWSLNGGYLHESASQLAQRYDDKFARLDVTQPISPTVALVGGIGYEAIRISNKDALRDGNGVPVQDSNGRFVTDPASPRRLAYDISEIIWDAGVLWRPSPRTSAELRVGHRYGSMSYTGNLRWQPSQRDALSVTLFDGIDSFGRALNSALIALPTDFIISRNPFSGDVAGCAVAGSGPGGACFTDTLSGLAIANYRNRGIVAQYSHQAYPWDVSAGFGYARRTFISDNQSVLAAANGVSDDDYFGVVGVTRHYGDESAVDGNVYVNYYDTGFAGGNFTSGGDVLNIGAYATYRRLLMRRLAAHASLGVDSVDRQGEESIITLLAQIGARYEF